MTGNARRTGPDVSYDATGYAVYTSVTVNGLTGWMTTGGTSAGAPQWAGLLAIADQGRALAGEPSLSDAVSAVYGLPASDFHDVTGGGNGAVSARAGYDTITGRGSPYANRVVSGLVGGAKMSTPPAPAPAPTPPPAPVPPAPLNRSLNLGFIASRFASFLRQTTGSSTPSVVAAKPAAPVRLPTGSSTFLGESISAADLLRALQSSSRR